MTSIWLFTTRAKAAIKISSASSFLEGADDWACGLSRAAGGGHVGLMYFILSKSADSLNMALKYACEGIKVAPVRIILDRAVELNQPINLSQPPYLACSNNNTQIIDFLLERGANDWDTGLGGACGGDNMAVALRIISYGASDWNRSLYEAVSNDHPQLAAFLIEKEADDWEAGFRGACKSGRMGFALAVAG